jgi:hypothetical protein
MKHVQLESNHTKCSVCVGEFCLGKNKANKFKNQCDHGMDILDNNHYFVGSLYMRSRIKYYRPHVL